MLNQLEIDDETYQLFVQETLELLHRLEEGLLNLQQEHSPKEIYNLMRAAHSIKGGASCVGLTGIQNIAHHLENVFKALSRENIKFDDRNLEELLLQAYDTLRLPLMEQIQNGKYETETYLQNLKQISTQLEAKLGYSLEDETQLPEFEMIGDINQFLFREEIGQGITRWERLLTNPNKPQLVEELKAQAEVFASLGELLNLPSFVRIAQTTILALKTNRSQVKTIGKLAAIDFRAVEAAVLNGDASPKISPSIQLVNFTQTSLPSGKDKIPKQLRQSVKLPGSSLLEDLEQTSSQSTTYLSKESSTSSLLEELEKTSSQLSIPSKLPESTSSLLEDLGNRLPKNGSESKNNPSETSHQKQFKAALPPVVPAAKKVNSKSGLPERDRHIHQSPLTQENLSGFKQNTTVEPPHHQNSELDFAKEAKPSQEEPQPTAKLGIRVDLERLDLIDNLVGDLVTQENSFLLQHEQNKEILDAINQKLQRFSKLTRNLPMESTIQIPQTTYSQQLPVLLAQTIAEEIAQLQEAVQDIALTHQQVQQIIKKRQQTFKQLQTNLLQTRMLPLGDLLKRFPRMVRDLAIKNHKQVNLQLVGMSTLVDKAILEKIYDPLIQMLRNAFDHGIEIPTVRQAEGKSPTGTITIRAYHQGNSTYIQVQDDGKGIDLEKIRATVLAHKWLTAEQVSGLSKKHLYEYLFAPGFSTVTKVSQLSGRGVGLDAVKVQVDALKGSIGVSSEPGKGTIFTLRLPFTLTITKLLVFTIKNNFLAIPVNTLVALAAASPEQITTEGDNEFYSWKNQQIMVYSSSLLSAYNYPSPPIPVEQMRGSYLWQKSGKIPLLLISSGTQIIALKIDQILMDRDLVIKPFGDVMKPPPYLYACTILGDGRLVPVIDAPNLVDWLQQKKLTQINSGSILPILYDIKAVTNREISTVLVIDDSVTMRKSLSLTLSKGGYQVLQARNGWEGLEQLRQKPEIKAIICDIEMPQINGFELITRCRKEFSDRTLPIIMLTSRSSEKYRLLAKQLGATAYLTKPYLDHNLLDILQKCLNQDLPIKG